MGTVVVLAPQIARYTLVPHAVEPVSTPDDNERGAVLIAKKESLEKKLKRERGHHTCLLESYPAEIIKEMENTYYCIQILEFQPSYICKRICHTSTHHRAKMVCSTQSF